MSDGDTLFDDGKDPEALRTIGEASKALKIKPHVLRYWEEQFPMLKPVTRAGGRRYYRPDDVALLERIRDLLYNEGFTIKGAQKHIGSRQAGGAAIVGGNGAMDDLGEAFSALGSARESLAQLRKTLED